MNRLRTLADPALDAAERLPGVGAAVTGVRVAAGVLVDEDDTVVVYRSIPPVGTLNPDPDVLPDALGEPHQHYFQPFPDQDVSQALRIGASIAFYCSHCAEIRRSVVAR